MTDKSIVLPEIPKSFYENLLDDKGFQGRIYKYSDDMIYKEYKHSISSYTLPHLEELSRQKSDLIVFPKTLVFEKKYSYDNFKGYLADYVEGNVIYKMNGEIFIDNFINALINLEKEIIRISQKGIRMTDMHQENLLYTKDNRLIAIDTDLFEKTYECSIKLVRDNIKELGESIISELITLAKLESDRLNNLINACAAYGKVKPSYVLKEFVDYFNSNVLHVETVDDFRQGIKLIKK